MDEPTAVRNDTMTEPLLTPSAALNREFILPDIEIDPNAAHQEYADRFVFQLGNYNFSIHVKETCQLLELSTLCTLPGTPKHVCGVTNVRGLLVPVFDLESYLGTEVKTAQRILRFGQHQNSVAILMPVIPQRKRFELSHRLSQLPPLPDRLRGFVNAAFSEAEGIYLDLDHPRLLQQIAHQVSPATNQNSNLSAAA